MIKCPKCGAPFDDTDAWPGNRIVCSCGNVYVYRPLGDESRVMITKEEVVRLGKEPK